MPENESQLCIWELTTANGELLFTKDRKLAETAAKIKPEAVKKYMIVSLDSDKVDLAAICHLERLLELYKKRDLMIQEMFLGHIYWREAIDFMADLKVENK